MSVVELTDISLVLPDGKSLFGTFSLGLEDCLTGLVGDNGTGKTTLARVIMDEIPPTTGKTVTRGKIAYLPQNFVLIKDQTVSQCLGIEAKLGALQRIYDGSDDLNDYEILDDDWNIAERTQNRLDQLGLGHLKLDRVVGTLSGGEATRLILAKLILEEPEYLILDEPTNNLDAESRQALFAFLNKYDKGALLISHDRELLSHVEQIVELSPLGVKLYGGNFETYKELKAREEAAALAELEFAELHLKKTQREAQQKKEIKEHRDSQGKKRAFRTGMGKLERKAQIGKAERTQGKLSETIERQLEEAAERKKAAQAKVLEKDDIRFDFPDSIIPAGKMVIKVEDVCFRHEGADADLFGPIRFTLFGPERLVVKGQNGSGKTTLLKLIQGKLQYKGLIQLGVETVCYLDQKAECLNGELSVLDNFRLFNPDLDETTTRYALAKFLFPNKAALQIVNTLSGGEKMRAALACLLMAQKPPQLLMLDEPTNHLDLRSIENIENALNQYTGAMIVISHDKTFLKNIRITHELEINTGIFSRV